MKKSATYIAAVVLAILYISVGGRIASEGMPTFEHIYQDSCEAAVVTGIVARQSAAQEIEGMVYGGGVNIIFTAELITGSEKGAMVSAIQNCDPDSPYNIREVKTGDKVLLTLNPNVENSSYRIMGEYVRTDVLVFLAAAFFILLIIFGRFKGFNTLLSLVFTCLAIFSVFIPAVLSAKNIYFWAVLTCVFIIAITLALVEGFNKKSLCAAVGCFAGVLSTGALYFISDRFLKLTGMVDEDSLYLKFLLDDKTIDLKAIVFAAIIIGAMGAIMDVAVSMASALYELKVSAPDSTPASLLRSGITIGQDMMGTMSNTLILAYIGSSLSVTLLLIAYSSSYLALFNREMIVVEVLQALIGSLGLLLTIPLTALVCAVLYCLEKKPARPDAAVGG